MTGLEQALITIRDECKKHAVCGDCPLRRRNVGELKNGNSICEVKRDIPTNWILKKDKNIPDEVPRLFV